MRSAKDGVYLMERTRKKCPCPGAQACDRQQAVSYQEITWIQILDIGSECCASLPPDLSVNIPALLSQSLKGIWKREHEHFGHIVTDTVPPPLFKSPWL